jgi:hypothetical protein
MVRRAYRQRSLVEVLLPDADKLWDPTLRRIDAVVLRMLVLKHLHDWSFDECERNVRGGAWSTARSVESTASAFRTPRP